MSDNLSNENVQREIETAIELENQLTISTEQQTRENLILKVQFLEEILKLRENKTKTKEANEEGEAASNESKKEKALRLLMKDEINEIIHVLRTQTGKEGKKHQKFYYWQKQFSVSETEPPQLVKKEKEKKREGKVIPATELVVVAAEDMFDKCMEIHNNVGKTGRQGMEVEAKKFAIVMHQKNRKYHSGIKTTPFNAMFGKEAYNGLECLNLPTESREQVKTVKDLYNFLSGKLEAQKTVSNKVKQIEEIRNKAHKAQREQADRMLSRQKKVINSFKVGDKVLLPCDGHDTGGADAENLLCIIMEKIPNSIQFRLGCKAGVLDQTYPFNVLTKTDLVTTFNEAEIPKNSEGDFVIVSVRQAISAISIAGGQGMKKCNCKTGKCNGGRCGCNSEGRKCNSKCHGGQPNPNCIRK